MTTATTPSHCRAMAVRWMVQYLYAKGVAVRIEVDSRGRGVSVPSRMKNVAALVIPIGPGWSKDVKFTSRDISFTVTLQGLPAACVIPWTHVNAATCPQGEAFRVASDASPATLAAERQRPKKSTRTKERALALGLKVVK